MTDIILDLPEVRVLSAYEMEELREVLGMPPLETPRKPESISTAPVNEVMKEQLEFLLEHARSGRHANCSECRRLDVVARELLGPFC